MKNQKVAEIEKSLMGEKDWKFSGEIKASSRPKDSLLHENIEFETALINVPISEEQNSEIIRYITARFREKTFDNFEFKQPKEKIEEEVYNVECLESNKEILELYEKIDIELKKIVDYGNDGFI